MQIKDNNIYLYVINKKVEAFVNPKEAKDLYGYERPDMVLPIKEFEAKGSLARIINDNIYLGKTEAELNAEEARQKRNIRNKLLQETDKYVLLDYPINNKDKSIILQYRIYLRDITKLKSFPNLDILTLEQWKLK